MLSFNDSNVCDSCSSKRISNSFKDAHTACLHYCVNILLKYLIKCLCCNLDYFPK